MLQIIRNSISSKLSCMSSLPARMRLIKSKMKELECSQDFSHHKSMGIFSRRSRAAHSAVHSPIWSNFEHGRDFMVVLLTCKNKEDRIKNRGARVFTTLYINFSDAQGQITLESVVVSDRNLNSSKLSCMSSLPARMRMIESKMKELEFSQDYPIISLWGFRSPWSDLAEFRTHPRCYGSSSYLQV